MIFQMELFWVIQVMKQWMTEMMLMEVLALVLVDNQEWEVLDPIISILKHFHKFKLLFRILHSQ